MLLPLQITFRGMDRSDAVEESIRERAERLHKFAPHITSCRVVVEPASKHHEHGNHYHVHIDVTLAGGEVAATHQDNREKEFKNIAIAARDAFECVARQLEDFVRRQRNDVKAHSSLPHARVSKLPITADYGFLTAQDGREIYFHRNSVLHDQFDALHEGSEVCFVERTGGKRPSGVDGAPRRAPWRSLNLAVK